MVSCVQSKVRLTHSSLALAFGVTWLIFASAARAEDQIQTYVVPKEHPAQSQPAPADSTMPASDIPVNSGHITWKTPGTWKELEPTSIRIGNFAVQGQDGQKAEVAIFSFPGAVGTELENVNRWRNELKLPPIDADKIVSEPVTVDSSPGKLYEIAGTDKSTVVVSLPRNGSTWFIKLRGDKDVVADAEPVFRDFLKTVRFGASTGQPPADAALAAASAGPNPHGDLTGNVAAPAPATVEVATGELKMAVPSNWIEQDPGPMIFKRYAVQNGQGPAVVTVSTFPGDVGGTFANVNRWRTQMSLPPIAQDQLADVTKAVATAGGKGTMVDFTGTDSRNGQPGRLIAVEVPHGDGTWFYKLSGGSAAVEKEKEIFLKFVKSVRYP